MKKLDSKLLLLILLTAIFFPLGVLLLFLNKYITSIKDAIIVMAIPIMAILATSLFLVIFNYISSNYIVYDVYIANIAPNMINIICFIFGCVVLPVIALYKYLDSQTK